jgi:TonB-dependent SusC/RagA subfamily outer membrane receptor
MKKNKFLTPLINRSWKKLLLTMKLCFLFVLISATTLMANSGYSQSTTLTVHLKNATLRDLIKVIEEQSEFIFVLADEVVDLDKPIDIQVKDQTIDKILDEILKPSELTYRIFDRQIGIGKRNPVTGAIDMPKPLEELMVTDKKLIGVVKDEKGDPLPGATVIVKGTSIGTITDGNGEFTLNVPSDSKILSFSFVGYKSQEVPIDNKATFNIVLKEMTTGLEEVVAVGYGIQKRVSVTGAVSSVVTKDLKQSPSPNFVGALSGRLPGLITIQNSGQPGAEGYNIYLRGVSTTNGQNPLIMIDGVPRTNITSIDPNEVASVSILKDASSTAVFGVRGANGVILITTKRGTTQTPQLNFTAEYGRMDLTREPTTVDSWDFAMLANEARANDGLLPNTLRNRLKNTKVVYTRGHIPIQTGIKCFLKISLPCHVLM